MTRRSPLRTFVAAVTAAALAVTGAVVVDTATAEPAHAAYPDTFNPFAMSGGFTVYARENALLQNQETEGSIAVGDTATVQGSSGTYSIIHVAAGTGDYTLPTVDGDPTRFLVGSYAPASTGILAITSAGTSDPALFGDLKMVERDGPWQAFSRADWLRLNTNPANPDQTPLIDATHQQYPASATPPTGAAGGSSIYTADTSAAAVADYVEANAEASYDEAAQCLADLSTTGYAVDVADNDGDRVVLAPLSADRPNLVDYAQIAGASDIQFSPGPTPGVQNPLIIRVPAGTTDVVGARIDPQGAYSPYTFWDLSAVTGDVSVVAGQGRMDGSIYAPDANVTVEAAPLDGQIIGNNVTIAGGEVHSFLFAGQISCGPVADVGTFEMRKALTGIAPGDLPEGTTFTVNYTATEPDGTVVTGSLELPADGATVDAGVEFPVGTVIDFEEIDPESVPGWEWGDAAISPDPLVIAAGAPAEVVVTNTATAQTGTFTVTKEIDDATGSTTLPAGTEFPVQWTAEYPDGSTATGELSVGIDGTPVGPASPPAPFPLGTTITLSEDLSGVTLPSGDQWAAPSWSPGSTFVIDDASTAVAVQLTNHVVPAPADTRVILIKKSVTGEAAALDYDYSLTYNTTTDLETPRSTQELVVDRFRPLTGVEEGVEDLALVELAPTSEGALVDVSDWEAPVITVTAGGISTSYEAAFGTPQVVEVPSSGVVLISVENALREGTFSVSKAFAGVSGDRLPSGVDFSVAWTAADPSGDVETGVIRVPANGEPVSPVGETFPFGTVVTFTELDAPAFPWLQWDTPVFTPSQLVVGAGGETTVSTTVTNSASLVTETFEVAKELDGIDASELLASGFTIQYTSWFPGRGAETGSFTIPADGEPAGPVDGNGDPLEFPVGTVIRVAEVPPAADALPPQFQWVGHATWSPSDTFLVRQGETASLTVTNSVQELVRWSGVKVLEGDAAGVPADQTYPIDWWLDSVPEPRLEIEANVVVTSRWFPVGSIIELREGELPAIPGVDWGEPTWTVDAQVLTPAPDGRVVLPTTATRDPDGVATLTLTNHADTRDLPDTGGQAMSAAVPFGAAVFILVGVALLIVRRRLA